MILVFLFAPSRYGCAEERPNSSLGNRITPTLDGRPDEPTEINATMSLQVVTMSKLNQDRKHKNTMTLILAIVIFVVVCIIFGGCVLACVFYVCKGDRKNVAVRPQPR